MECVLEEKGVRVEEERGNIMKRRNERERESNREEVIVIMQ